MSWIKSILYESAEGRLKELYDRVKGPGDYIDNILKVHGLRPHTLEGHMALYKSVMHHAGNELPKWLLETLGIYVSLLNECEYCVSHHFEGLRRILEDDERATTILEVLKHERLAEVFNAGQVAVFAYARMLTRSPWKVARSDIAALQKAGLSDGEILEINQVVSYFAYANRTVLGLGVTTEGDILGLSPTGESDEADWHHQ